MSWRRLRETSNSILLCLRSSRDVKCLHIKTATRHTSDLSASSANVKRLGTSENTDPSIDSQTITISGLVRSIRKQKKVAFAHISDGRALEPIQAILDPTQAKDITNGSYVELTGTWETSPGKGQAYELHVQEVDNVGETVPDDFPVQKKSQTIDFLRTLPHLRMRTPLFSLLGRARGQLISSLHDFYHTARPAGPAIQVHPPLITSSDCEGAGEVFTISPKNSISPPEANGQQNQLYFRDHKYLTVSTQLHLEAYSAELGDVWTLSPIFRAEESDTPRHLSEFYMLEAEFRGVKRLEIIMCEAQQLLQYLVDNLTRSESGKDLIKYYSDSKHSSTDDSSKPNLEERWQKVLTKDWPILSYREAIQFLQAQHNAHPDKFVHAPSYATGLQLEHERCLVTEFANNVPLFIVDYPEQIKPFYMLPSNAWANSQDHAADQTVSCFDLLFPYGTAEIVGGSLREHRLHNLVEAMRRKGLLKRNSVHSSGTSDKTGYNVTRDASSSVTNYPYLQSDETLGSLQWYADLRRFGSSPHGGFGMGFDRLLSYVSGIASVRDTVGFPRYFGRADC